MGRERERMKVRSITQLACADLTRNTDKTLMTSSKTRTMTNMYCNSTISIRRFCQIKYTVNSSVYYMTDVPVLSRIHAKFPKVPLLSVCVCVCVLQETWWCVQSLLRVWHLRHSGTTTPSVASSSWSSSDSLRLTVWQPTVHQRLSLTTPLARCCSQALLLATSSEWSCFASHF